MVIKVIDHEPQTWFLFQSDNLLLLDANCNHGAFGYSYMIELSADEVAEYKNGGHDYLSKLAFEIQYSAPVAKGSNSKYIGRDVSKKYSEQAMVAIKEWRNSNETVT